MAREKDYPTIAYATKKLWRDSVRARWKKLSKSFEESAVREGSAYYPEEVYEWLKQKPKMDELMRNYHK